MQKRLRQVVAKNHYEANITAGLGSVFVALGERYLKDSGTIALVLPRALLSGVAWSVTRRLLEKSFVLDYVVVSHEPGRWNFSENTSLSEVLLVARRDSGHKPANSTYINLWRQPLTQTEALSVASQILQGHPAELEVDDATTDLLIGPSKIGEVCQVSWGMVKGTLWSFPCTFAQSVLNRAVHYLRQGKVHVPGTDKLKELPLKALGGLGRLGFDRRDIHDGFEESQNATNYPSVWGHDCTRNMTMVISPNRYLRPLGGPKTGRKLRKPSLLWQGAGRVLLAERMRLNTMRIPAGWTPREVLSNVWWTFRLSPGIPVDVEKAMVLWFNSTLGLLLYLAHKSETEGPFVDFKKPVLESMPVPDFPSLGRRALRKLSVAFDRLSADRVAPLGEIVRDPTRVSADQTFCEILHLPDLSPLREALSREPILTGSLANLLPS
jgi:hypothetical protein